MRYIFLDVDGVLNSRRHMGKHPRHEKGIFGIAEEHIRLLSGLLRDLPNTSIVVSSTWRKGGIGPGSDFYRGCAQYPEGLEVLSRVVGKTPVLSGIRGEEILSWCVGNKVPVEKIVILDDDNDMGPVLDRLVQTNYQVGLDEKTVEAARSMLLGA